MSPDHIFEAGATPMPTTTPADAGADPGPRRLDRVTTLCHTANYARRHLEHTVLHDAHLTWTSYDVLHLAVMHRPIDTGVLAALACVSKGTVTRAATALIKRGLLRRSTPDGDRRRALLAPTSQGWALNYQLRAHLIDELTQLIDTDPTTDTHDVATLRRLISTREPNTRPDQTGHLA
jgi:DNA-binding MarR family transcriptional regulator